MHLLNADLHSHSRVSDGTSSPAALAERAHANGVELWSLTDHDEIAGQREAREAALDLHLDYLSGTEISVSFAGETVHILGFGFDPDDAALGAGLAAVRSGRVERARRMGASLAAAGIAGAFEGALRHAGNPAMISRTHFARFLIESGRCSDNHEVFRHFLKPGKPGYAEHRWAGLGEAVRWIRGAGGIAVIAHPARYQFAPTLEYALFSEFVGHGGAGVEVVTGAHSAAEQGRYAEVALEFGLLASRGSDFHDAAESRIDLGSLPDLPGRLTPVWQALEARIQRAAAASR
ncbi:MAG: PHP domain-containing protein [Burkholderiales bacterium]|nr:PHP domain-containing protein [Burkholderiales bacterium]MDE2457512.1 PHP domain-containing protein [Burkholderiales bacterium]